MTVASYADCQGLYFTSAQFADTSVSSAAACPVGDGISNLMKYSQGLLPLANASVGGLPTTQAENGYPTLTYVRLKNATDLVYTPEVSSDQSLVS